MQEIDLILDEDTSFALEYVELDIRNQQAHRELQSYNDTQQFLYEHPITRRSKIHNELAALQKEDPLSFLKTATNIAQNIKRIRSNINTKKYKDQNELLAWQNNLKNAELQQNIITKLISK